MFAQLVEDLIHFKGGEDGFDQDGGADGSAWNAQFVLRETEYFVPEARLEMVLQFWQIEVRAGSLFDQGVSIVEKEQPKVEEGPGDGLPVNQEVLLVQVPTARTNQQGGQFLAKFVALAFRTLVRNGSADRVPKIVLALNIVIPGRRIRVLEIGHKNTGARVERIDDHFAIDGTGDFYAAIKEILGNGCHLPIALADAFGLGQEVGKPAAIEFLLDGSPPRQQLLAARLESCGEF